MNKDQLIKALKAAASELIERHAYSQGLSEEREGEIRELLATVPLTESEERIEALREEILARSEAKAAPAVRRTGFGIPLIQSQRAERVKFYDNIEEIAADFDANTLEYSAASDIFSQNGGARIAIGPEDKFTFVAEAKHPAWSTPEVPEVLTDASGKVYKRTGDGNE